MATSDLKNFTPDEDLVGCNLARTIRLISKLLLDWCSHGAGTGQGESARPRPPTSYLTAIYFDKLAEFFCRIWDGLSDKRKLRYPSALKSYRGFHGPGRATKINRIEEEERSLGRNPYDYRRHELAYTTEIAEKLKPSLGNARILFRVTEKPPPWDYRCRIYPQLDPSQWESWLADSETEDDETVFLTASEVAYVDEISRLICLLNREELRAIGTHQSAQKTCSDIRFNLRAWVKHFDNILAFIEGHSSELGRSGDIIVSTAKEVLRKSNDNKPPYKSAYLKICGGIRSPDIREVFHAVQMDASDIWANGEISKFRYNAQDIVDLSVYCRQGLACLGVMLKFKKKREKDEAEESFLRLTNKFVPLNIVVHGYDQIMSLNQFQWTMNLRIIKDKILEKIPSIEDRRHLGIDDL